MEGIESISPVCVSPVLKAHTQIKYKIRQNRDHHKYTYLLDHMNHGLEQTQRLYDKFGLQFHVLFTVFPAVAG